ncbi:hypothetical protein SEA_SNEK_38 [Arthrobacter phage Snek]|uniref:Uncharacterized protein n=1 Tax=Arthrobacter phage Tweety19 TaxID=2768133 RepID=A0A7G9W265_9CAUD|nr:hypothetical protein PQE19_gp38 [Arthrobacter phage Tweety19]QNO12728.1 hypothetical protein SEA_TWEETY19_38 [Arthrobacter phage Tweety19]
MDFELEDVDLELNEREYICPACRLTHWQGAPDPCDRS